MINFAGWWLPDGEVHLPEWMMTVGRKVDGRLTYQYHKYETALAFCQQRRLAVDIGAHVGLWSYWMARDFASVMAFEPHPDHRSCWRLNMEDKTNAELFPYALGPDMATVALTTGPSSSGDTYVDRNVVGGDIPQWPLDRFDMQGLDFLKIDAEGYEVFILQGAKQTLERHRPVIIVEQKPEHGKKYGISDTAGAALLAEWGYRQRKVINGDFILTPSEWH